MVKDAKLARERSVEQLLEVSYHHCQDGDNG